MPSKSLSYVILGFTKSVRTESFNDNTIAAEWKPVEREVFIPLNLDTLALEVKTDSLVGSNDLLSVMLYSNASRESKLGQIAIKFEKTVKYFDSGCSNSWKDLPNFLPTTRENIWRFTFTRSFDESRIQHYHNGKRKLIPLMDKIACDHKGKTKPFWNRIVTHIAFSLKDTASDYFRALPPS